MREPCSPPPLELWGGLECTVNRVGDRFADQSALSGHNRRIDDLDRFAALGLKAIRYPVLWERVAPRDPSCCDWRWSDARLARIRALGMRPIVGLVHHGSGPAYTSLADSAFAEKLADYGTRVASRYPWVEDFTPVNEPLTTARFSGLYGHWYPHARDGRTFLLLLLNQIRATVATMCAIRRVTPGARLIQTEDLGKTHATRPLLYQARFENERRWLTFDLLAGRVDRHHPLWPYIRAHGLAAEFDALREDPCPPDVIGVNHYLSSERFLDHRLERYPPDAHGGNGRHRYADVLALRVLANGVAGPEVLLTEAWQRFARPIAVTEVHNGCTREEQMRWFLEVWRAAENARARGADIRAVTAWSLLGAFDWDSLLTRMRGHYEPGVFDLRASAPRPTAMVPLLRDLAHSRTPAHPALDAPGWWHRRARLAFPAVRRRVSRPSAQAPRRARRLLIIGATGTLGRAFARLCAVRGLTHDLVSRADIDIADQRSVSAGLARYKPWAVINTAGFVRVDDAEDTPAQCRRENEAGPRVLAEACASAGLALVSFSSDLVFDGAKRAPYTESDPVKPLCVYGETKAAAERAILARLPAALVIRTSAFFGPWDEYNFAHQALISLGRGQKFTAAHDIVISPTYVPHLVHATLDLLIDAASGLWHLSNQGEASWAELARELADRAGLDRSLIQRIPARSMPWRAKRPTYSVLGSERASLMPPLATALNEYFAAR